MKAFLTVGGFAGWEKFAGDAVVSSSASKKTPTFFEKTPTFFEKTPMFLEKSPTFLENLPTFFRKRPTFLRVMPAVARKISLSLHVGKMCACS